MSTRNPERFAEVERLVAEGNMGEVAELLLKITTRNSNRWWRDDDTTFAVVRDLPQEARRRLADALKRLSEPYREGDPTRINALTLLTVVTKDLPGDELAAERRRRLDHYGRLHSTWSPLELTTLAAAELASGREVPGPTVATLRRSALMQWSPVPELTELVALLPDPVLNPGEEWADRALDDLEGRGHDWLDLVRHAATAKTAKPNAKWEKTARACLARLDADDVRTTVLPWLALVDRPAPCSSRPPGTARMPTMSTTRTTPKPCAASPGPWACCPATRTPPARSAPSPRPPCARLRASAPATRRSPTPA